MKHWTLDKWVAAGLLGLMLMLGGIFVTAYVRRGGSELSPHEDRSAGKKRSPARAISDIRKDLVEQLAAGLKQALQNKDSKRAVELARDLERQGDQAVEPMLAVLKTGSDWNVSVELIAILGRMRSRTSIDALSQFYRLLGPNDRATKREVVKALSRIGAKDSRDALLQLLAVERDSELRKTFREVLLQTGLRPQEIAALAPAERELLEQGTVAKEAQRSKLEELDKKDPGDDEGFAALRQAALDERTVAVALVALAKLEKRNDQKAAEVLAERIRMKAESQEEKIIQTNALAGLARMRVSHARSAVRQFALGSDPGLRRQAIELVGSFGDEAMLPVLEQARHGASPELQKAVERAMLAIRSRSSQKQSSSREGS